MQVVWLIFIMKFNFHKSILIVTQISCEENVNMTLISCREVIVHVHLHTKIFFSCNYSTMNHCSSAEILKYLNVSYDFQKSSFTGLFPGPSCFCGPVSHTASMQVFLQNLTLTSHQS